MSRRGFSCSTQPTLLGVCQTGGLGHPFHSYLGSVVTDLGSNLELCCLLAIGSKWAEPRFHIPFRKMVINKDTLHLLPGSTQMGHVPSLCFGAPSGARRELGLGVEGRSAPHALLPCPGGAVRGWLRGVCCDSRPLPPGSAHHWALLLLLPLPSALWRSSEN
jgi:hypothetical protein